MAEKEKSTPSGQPPQQRDMVPAQEFERMERMFQDFFRHPFSMFNPSQWLRRMPEMEEINAISVDIFEEGNDLVVKAEIPGMRKEDIEVSFSDNNIITISGEKKKEEKIEEKNYYRMERSYGRFSRNIYLPAEVNPEQAAANFKEGVLEIHIPKTEQSLQKVKKINIQ